VKTARFEDQAVNNCHDEDDEAIRGWRADETQRAAIFRAITVLALSARHLRHLRMIWRKAGKVRRGRAAWH
jgi:hypothetical protein